MPKRIQRRREKGERNGGGAVPVRLQRRRTKGYRLPPNAIYVGRPGPWGNPFVVDSEGVLLDRAAAVVLFRQWVNVGGERQRERIRSGLRGHDLVCWCPLEDANGQPVPCHADVLLELANR